MKSPPQNFLWKRRRTSAFSLIELLVVMAIIAALSAVSLPAIQSLKAGHSVNKAVADLSGTLELARSHAMANRTYVRVLLGEVPAGGDQVLPQILVQPVYSANGSASGDMSKPDQWPALGKPLVLENLRVFDAMEGSFPVDTSADVTPMGGRVLGTFMDPVVRKGPGRADISYTGVIQFSPTGEARVSFDEPARYIKIALDQPGAGNAATGMKKNPLILRLSGMNGSIRVLRAGEIAL